MTEPDVTKPIVTGLDSPTPAPVVGLAGLVRQTAADRRAAPDWLAIAENAADKWGSCRRPVPMWMTNPVTGERHPIGAACGNTLESVCPACAKRKRAIRVRQAHEGWHLEQEPVCEKHPITEQQTGLWEARCTMFDDYQTAKANNDVELMAGIREVVTDLDRELRETGVRRRIPPLDAPTAKPRNRSTRRREDVPNLPRRKVESRTVGEVFAGKYRPGMFLTLTMPSYGRVHQDGAVNHKGQVCGDGSPIDPDTYDYRRAARDIIHFTTLYNRWVQNLRRAVGWNAQYFATVEPQRRGAPHIHALFRGALPNAVVREVTAATYVNIWWPHHDHEYYTDGRMPVWDFKAGTFVDPESKQPLAGWDEAQEVMRSMDDQQPSHVIRFGVQVKPKGILKGTPKADSAIGYLAKYLTKSTAEILEAPNERTRRHYERLHEELKRTPCSPSCGVWLRYGIVPKGASDKTIPGRCGSKAHKREHVGVPGERHRVSGLWTGKTQADHAAERRDEVKQLLDGAGIEVEDTSGFKVVPAKPGDPHIPPRAALIMSLLAQVQKRRSDYDEARMRTAEGPPEDGEDAKQLPTAA